MDLNKHFPSNWDIEQRRKPKAPSYRDFPGTAPLTEPEAQAMHRLITEQPPDRMIALHTQGEEIYWGYEGCEPEQSSRMIREFEAISGNRYQGVKTIDSHAGFRDWFIQQYGKEGYTIELRKEKTLCLFISLLIFIKRRKVFCGGRLFFETSVKFLICLHKQIWDNRKEWREGW